MEKAIKWPDNVRLEMIEKSNFYQEPKIYQYGYYDGFHKLLKSANVNEMINFLEKIIIDYNNGEIEDIEDIVNKSEQLINQIKQ